MKTLLLFLAFAFPVFAAGSVSQTITQLGASSTFIVRLDWTGDAATGAVPATSITGGSSSVQQAFFQQIQGYTFLTVETSPGTPSPAANYNVTITDASGADILQSAALGLSSTVPALFGVPTSSPPVSGTFTFNVTSQSVASAKGSVFIFVTKPNSSAKNSGGLSGLILAKIPKATSTSTLGNSSISDNGVTVSTPEPFNAASLSTGPSPPALTGTGIAGLGESTGQGCVAAADCLIADSASHRLKLSNNNAAADPLVGQATADTLTNKTFDTAGAGNSLKIAGTAITAISGSGAVCLASGSACGSAVTHPHTLAAGAFGGSTFMTGVFNQSNTVGAACPATDLHFIPVLIPACYLLWFEDGTTNATHGIVVMDEIPSFTPSAVKLTLVWMDNGSAATYQYKVAYAVTASGGAFGPPTYSTAQNFTSQLSVAGQVYIQTVTLTGVSFVADNLLTMAIGRVDNAGYGHLIQANVEYLP